MKLNKDMKANWIRYRLKSDKQIYECSPSCLQKDGRLEHTIKRLWGEELVNDHILLNPNEYEIIPQQDFFEFRRETARQILCTILETGVDYHDSLIDRAIEITDKLIEKL